MRVCLLCPEPTEWADVRPSVEALAAALAPDHEVGIVRSGVEPPFEPPALDFACPDHLHSAVAMESIRRAYGERGPDYLEVPDFRGHGLVPLHARLGGDPLLAGTAIAVRTLAPTELICLHDGTLRLPGRRRVAALEREQLRLADRIVWPGGDALDVQRRYRGADLPLPPAVRIPPPTAAPTLSCRRDRSERLRLLYLGPLQRHRGVLDLVEALLVLDRDEWELTLCGRDTATAAMGQSVRATIETMSGEDPRIRFEEGADAAAMLRRAGEFDLLAVPSRFQVWSEEAVAGLAAGLPVLATPVGGLAEIVEDGVNGWQAAGLGAGALSEALARIAGDRAELERVRGSTAPVDRARELGDPARARRGYRRLAAEGPPPPAPAAGEALVTGVVPYFAAADYVADAVGSLLAQTHRNLEVLIVNDGSFAAADAVLDELARDPRVTVVTQPNRGESSARNLGALLAEGEFVVMLDADNVLEPTFVERALGTFRGRPELAYVGCWLRMVGADGGDLPEPRGYAAFGNGVLRDEDRENWDGDTLAMLPRSLFAERGFAYEPQGSMHSDWGLYRALREAGLVGMVIPECLARYRMAPGSLLRGYGEAVKRRGWEEVEVWNGLRGVRWTAEDPA